jgi:hypothetical protein
LFATITEGGNSVTAWTAGSTLVALLWLVPDIFASDDHDNRSQIMNDDFIVAQDIRHICVHIVRECYEKWRESRQRMAAFERPVGLQ